MKRLLFVLNAKRYEGPLKATRLHFSHLEGPLISEITLLLAVMEGWPDDHRRCKVDSQAPLMFPMSVLSGVK